MEIPSESENSWIPLSDIPTTFNETIEHFHHCHPHAPHPHVYDINKNFSNFSSVPPAINPTFSAHSDQVPPSVPPAATRAPCPAVPLAAPRPAFPPAVRQSLRSEYVPPMQTTTRSGRVAHLRSRLDPVHIKRTRKTSSSA